MLVKPSVPILDPAELARTLPGCKGLWLLNERGGATCRDLSGNGRHGTLQGTTAAVQAMRGTGLYGGQIGSFTTSNYLQLPGTPQVLAAGFPFWMATLAVGTQASASQGQLIAATQSGGLPFCTLEYGRVAVGDVYYEYRDSASATVSFGVSVGSNDGKPHVAMAVSYGPSDHRLYWDGQQVASSTVTVTTNAFDRLSVGVWTRNDTPNSPLSGSVITAAIGRGLVPTSAVLAADWLSGRFAAARPRRSMLFLPTTTSGWIRRLICCGE